MPTHNYYPGKDLPQGVERHLMGILNTARGSEYAVSRDRINELLATYHRIELDDRSMRKAIENIRRMGVRLCDLEDGSGLFIAKTEDEYRAFKLRYGAHAFSLMATIRAMDKGVPVDQLGENIEVAPTQMQLI